MVAAVLSVWVVAGVDTSRSCLAAGCGDWWLQSCDYTSSAAQPAPTTATVPLYRTVHSTIATVQSTTSEDTLYSFPKLNLSVYSKEAYKDKQLRRLFVKLRQGSGKDWQGMAVKAKGVKALTLA